MDILHTGRGMPFKDVKRGAQFHFMFEGKWLIALKVSHKDFGSQEAGVMLTEGHANLPPFANFSPDAAGDRTVLELTDVALVPSADEHAVIATPGRYAEPGELELKDGKVLLVILLSAGSFGRMNVETGEVGSSGGSRPIICTEWSLVQRATGQQGTTYTRIYTRKSPAAVGEPA